MFLNPNAFPGSFKIRKVVTRLLKVIFLKFKKKFSKFWLRVVMRKVPYLHDFTKMDQQTRPLLQVYRVDAILGIWGLQKGFAGSFKPCKEATNLLQLLNKMFFSKFWLRVVMGKVPYMHTFFTKIDKETLQLRHIYRVEYVFGFLVLIGGFPWEL